MNYLKLITITNDILDSIGEVPPLSIGITPRRKRITIEAPAGNIAQHRRLIDRMALLLGTEARLRAEPAPTYEAMAERDGASVLLTLLGVSHSSVDRGGERVTSTGEMRDLLASVAEWMDGLDPALAHTLTVSDCGRRVGPMLHVDAQGDYRGAAGKLVKGLPVDIQEYTYGAEGSALLPTGHTLAISTL